MKNVLRNSLLGGKMVLSALLLSTSAMAQEGPDPDIDFPDPMPCEGVWYDRIPNAEAPIAMDTYTGVKYGYQKIFYVNGDISSPDYGKVMNIWGTSYQNFGALNSSSVSVFSGDYMPSDLILNNGSLYYVGWADQKFHKLTYTSGVGWVPSLVNNHANATASSNTHGFGGSFDINPTNNRIFFNQADGWGTETKVNFLDGPSSWQVGSLDAPSISSTGEIVHGNIGVYFKGDDDRLYMKVYDPVSGWSTNSVNGGPAIDYSSPFTYANNRLFYIDAAHKIRMVDENIGAYHIMVDPLSMHARLGRTAVVAKGNSVIYVGLDNRIYLTTLNGGVWSTQLVHATAEVAEDTKMDFIEGSRIAYVSRFDNKIHELYFCGFSLKKEATSETNMANTHQIKDFTVYPNPAEDQVVIAVNAELPGTIQVVNTAGQVVQQESYNEGIYQEQMDIQNLDKGIYFIRIISNSGEQLKVEKLIKK